MLRSEKQEFVASLEEIYRNSSSVIVTHYHGLTVSQMTKLRKTLKEDNAGFKVVKNTLSKIAGQKANLDLGVLNTLSGPTAIIYSNDPIITAKKVVEFAKTNDKLKIIGGIVDNEQLDLDAIQKLAKLPSLNEARSNFLGVLQASAAQFHQLLQIHIDNNDHKQD